MFSCSTTDRDHVLRQLLMLLFVRCGLTVVRLYKQCLQLRVQLVNSHKSTVAVMCTSPVYRVFMLLLVVDCCCCRPVRRTQSQSESIWHHESFTYVDHQHPGIKYYSLTIGLTNVNDLECTRRQACFRVRFLQLRNTAILLPYYHFFSVRIPHVSCISCVIP